MATGRKCIECGAINELHVMVCDGCGADLRYAPEIADEPVEPAATQEERDSNPQRAPGSTSVCTCPKPDAAPGDVHFACGGVVPQVGDPAVGGERTSPPQSRTAPTPAADAPIVVTLPGGRQIEVGQGCFIGRDQRRADILVHAALGSLKGVSLAHAWICCAGDAVVVLDIGSHNGTWIGERCLPPWQAHVVGLDELPINVRLGLHGWIRIEMEE